MPHSPHLAHPNPPALRPRAQVHGDYTAEAAAAAAASEKIERPAEEVVGMAPEGERGGAGRGGVCGCDGWQQLDGQPAGGRDVKASQDIPPC